MERVQCAELDVPLDHTDPDGTSITLALRRVRAGDPDQRIGVLFVNPGGPGKAATDFATSLYLGPEIAEHFDLVGFDPRGVGGSTPLECNTTLGSMYALDPAPRTPADTQALLTASERFAAECGEKYGDLLPHMGTREVARDMDAIRAAMGEEQINYLGYSYGTSIGQTYADLFPSRVRTMVLDGVVELGQPGIAAAQAQGVAFEKVLDESFDACRADASCPIRDDPEGTFDTVRAALEEAPIPARYTGGRVLTTGTFQLAVAQNLYNRESWSRLWDGLARVHAPDPDGANLLQDADRYLGWTSDGTYEPGFEAYFAVSCLDWSWPDEPEGYLQAGRKIAEQAPRMGEAIVTDYVRCAYWPTPPQPLTPVRVDEIAPIVVVSTTNDPATPYDNGADLAKALPGAVLVTKEGSSHTAFGHGDPCVDTPVIDYLVSATPPSRNLHCP